MKETYISPELELLCLAPREALASNGNINLDDLFEQGDLGLDMPNGGGISNFDVKDDVAIIIPDLLP